MNIRDIKIIQEEEGTTMQWWDQEQDQRLYRGANRWFIRSEMYSPVKDIRVSRETISRMSDPLREEFERLVLIHHHHYYATILKY